MSERERKSLLRYTEAAADVEIKETPECVRFLEYYREREVSEEKKCSVYFLPLFFYSLFRLASSSSFLIFDRVFYT